MTKISALYWDKDPSAETGEDVGLTGILHPRETHERTVTTCTDANYILITLNFWPYFSLILSPQNIYLFKYFTY